VKRFHGDFFYRAAHGAQATTDAARLVLHHDRDTARNWLATTLWPDNDEAQARFYLRKSLSNLRHALEGEATRLQTPDRRTVRLDMTGAFADVIAFDSALTAGELPEAVALYRGPLLPDCLEQRI
jgi:DNA-binding SARP family transcriptional activator